MKQTIISINAPHAGCDRPQDDCPLGQALFQSNAPRAGCDRAYADDSVLLGHFNLTHPMRGASGTLGCQN